MQMEPRLQASFGVHVSEGQSTLAPHDFHSVGVQPNVSMIPSFVGFFTSLEPHLVSVDRRYSCDSFAPDAGAAADVSRECDMSGTLYDGGKLVGSLVQSANVGLPQQKRSNHGDDPDGGRRQDVFLGLAGQPDEVQLRWDDSPLGSSEPGRAEKTSEVIPTQEPEAPPWSKLKTKAGKQRRRLPVACSSCRQRKVRCSGEEPTCKQCLRSRMSCVYKTRVRKTAPRARRTMSSEERATQSGPAVKTEEAQSDAYGISNHQQQSMDSASLGGRSVNRSSEALGSQDASRRSSIYDSGSNARQSDQQHQRQQQQVLDIKLSMPLEEARTLPSNDSQHYPPQMYYDNLQGHLLHPPLLLPDGYFEQRSNDHQAHASEYGLGTSYGQAHSGGTTPSRRPSHDEGVHHQSFGGGHFDIHPSMLHPPLLWPPQPELPSESDHVVPSHRGSFSQVDTNVTASLPPATTMSNHYSHHDPSPGPVYGGSGSGMEGPSNTATMADMEWPPPFSMNLEPIQLWFEMHGQDLTWQQSWHFGDGNTGNQSTSQEPSTAGGHMPLHPPYLLPPNNESR